MLAFRMSTTEQGMSFNVNIKAVEGIKKEYLSPTILSKKHFFIFPEFSIASCTSASPASSCLKYKSLNSTLVTDLVFLNMLIIHDFLNASKAMFSNKVPKFLIFSFHKCCRVLI